MVLLHTDMSQFSHRILNEVKTTDGPVGESLNGLMSKLKFKPR